MEQISVFDIFKICIGPSSSHTMGPWVAANTFVTGLDLTSVKSVKVKLYGSLSKTGKGHGTDIAVQLGLAGYHVENIEVRKLNEYILEISNTQKLYLNQKTNISFVPDVDIEFHSSSLPEHANALTFVATYENDQIIEKTYFSVGGGFIVESGKTILQNSKNSFPFPIHSEKDLLGWTKEMNLSICDIILRNELTLRSLDEIHTKLMKIWDVMLSCMHKGCHSFGILPGGLDVKRRAGDINKSLLNGLHVDTKEDWMKLIKCTNPNFANTIKWVSCFALAVNEENASFGRVVTAPTNGAAGVIPAVLMYYLCFCENKGKEDIIKFLLTAGEMGSLFKKGATISAAMGGCQAEIGVSSAMAAGALTLCQGGTTQQVLMATEIAMEHHLGLTCDPVLGLVQIPCIERNSMGAMKAITASQIAMSSDPNMAKVSLDSIIKTMKETADDMIDKYKETAEGGLAVNVSVLVPEC